MDRAKSVDPAEIERFRASAQTWWDANGAFSALHRLNPVRLSFIRENVIAHFAREEGSLRPLAGLGVLDIGCGGGLLSEPLARLGGDVTGIDPAAESISAARAHAHDSGLEIDYRATSAEALADEGARFDIVLAMEVIEHVTDAQEFIATCTSLVAPGGMMFAATINRTLKSFVLAIVGAEYVLGWVPRGTHEWEKFVTPAELESALERAGFQITSQTGVIYNPLSTGWQRGRDMGVNYMLAARLAEG
ncbi:MAG: bifunctional 2-polyprenyl-6-hydroxyphenol methylase/3-demethylubiquinol 3-O-methyltransferase UbiG [Rhizobiales bacterium]|nr:bifunctional 2-polyprenyl-6-hydroxyphenol methylase/3-demethylubiquinol 3-O-methyltransferase UbiG [Hyphomicrobiales bacterium]